MSLERNTVLEDIKIEKNNISIEELPFVGKINLRGDTKDRDFMSNAGSILDILIPTEPNTKIENKDLQVIWLSPNEWLLSFLNDDHFIRIFDVNRSHTTYLRELLLDGCKQFLNYS